MCVCGCVCLCSQLFCVSLGVPQGPSVLFFGYDADYRNISYYVKMTLHVKTVDIKGDPNTSGHSKFLTARHTWVKWKSDNPNARMHRSDVDALEQTLVKNISLAGEFTYNHKPEFVPLKEW